MRDEIKARGKKQLSLFVDTKLTNIITLAPSSNTEHGDYGKITLAVSYE